MEDIDRKIPTKKFERHWLVNFFYNQLLEKGAIKSSNDLLLDFLQFVPLLLL